MNCKKRCKCEECELCYSSPMLVRDDRWNTPTWPDTIQINGYKCGATGKYAPQKEQLKNTSINDDEVLFTENKELVKNIFASLGVVIK